MPLPPWLIAWFAVLPVVTAATAGGYRGPDRNGVYPAGRLLAEWPADGPPLLWTYRGLGPGWGPPAVTADAVYCVGGAPRGRVHALELATGRALWITEYGPEFTSRFDGTRSTPTVAAGRVVFSSGKKDERSVYCLRAVDGKPLWHVDGNARYGGAAQGWGYNESPLVIDGKVVFCLRAKDDVCPPVVAVDLETGATVWRADPGPGDLSAGDCSVSLIGEGENRLLLAHLWRGVLALEPDTGELAWRMDITKGTIVTPVYRDGHLLLGMGGITAFRLADDLRSYERLWSAPLEGICQAVIEDGKVFGIGRPGGKKRAPRSWLCYDLETGELLASTPCLDQGSVIAADGLVYVVEGGEHHWKTPRFSLLRPTDRGFELAGQFTPVVGTKELWANPAVAEDRLFHRHGDLLAVYDLRAER